MGKKFIGAWDTTAEGFDAQNVLDAVFASINKDEDTTEDDDTTKDGPSE